MIDFIAFSCLNIVPCFSLILLHLSCSQKKNEKKKTYKQFIVQIDISIFIKINNIILYHNHVQIEFILFIVIKIEVLFFLYCFIAIAGYNCYR